VHHTRLEERGNLASAREWLHSPVLVATVARRKSRKMILGTTLNITAPISCIHSSCVRMHFWIKSKLKSTIQCSLSQYQNFEVDPKWTETCGIEIVGGQETITAKDEKQDCLHTSKV
jgi:hypothetical protein